MYYIKKSLLLFITILVNNSFLFADIELFSIFYSDEKQKVTILGQSVYDSEKAKADELEIQKNQAEIKKNNAQVELAKKEIEKIAKEKELIKKRIALKRHALKTSINNNLS